MSVLQSFYNPKLGQLEWKIVQNGSSKDYDFEQEIARSSFADMINDHERNIRYFDALKTSVAQIKERGDIVRVLDIGTGSGLLAMMAVSCGADYVMACEAFSPISKVAKRIIASNNMNDKIRIIDKRSTDMNIHDLVDSHRVNLIVAEVFDTELIGEGALRTFRHAITELGEPGCLTVPHTASVFALPVTSKIVRRWNLLDAPLIHIPDCFVKCPGSLQLHDVQLSALVPGRDFFALTDPLYLKEFDFSDVNSLTFDDSKSFTVRATSSGSIDGVFFWWTLKMDQTMENILSCAPEWALPFDKTSATNWRDHWMQAIYYPQTQLTVSLGESFRLLFTHDEYSWLFNVSNDTQSLPLKRPLCQCNLHLAHSRRRIGQLNEACDGSSSSVSDFIEDCMSKSSDSTFVTLGDASLLPLQVAGLTESETRRIFHVETQPHSARFVRDMAEFQDFAGDPIRVISDLDTCNELTTEDSVIVIAEPYLSAAHLPWDHMLHYWQCLEQLRLANKSVAPFPSHARIMCVAVSFDDLWKSHSVVGPKVCGFDLTLFDELITDAMQGVDHAADAISAWEYGSIALSDPTQCVVIDFSDSPADFNFTIALRLRSVARQRIGDAEFKDHVHTNGCCEHCSMAILAAECSRSALQCETDLKLDDLSICQCPFHNRLLSPNAIILWIDYYYNNKCVSSTGPFEKLAVGERCFWERNHRQAVVFNPCLRQHALQRAASDVSPVLLQLTFNAFEMNLLTAFHSY